MLHAQEGIRSLMKIEDSHYRFNGASPVDKLRRTSQSSALDAAFDNYDLSFLDMLTSVVSETLTESASESKQVDAPDPDKKTNVSESTKEKSASPKLSLVGHVSAVAEEESATRVEQDMVMFKEDMTDIDVQYMKQAVIPGLPILVGSVPFETVFPVDADQEISYRGFEISPKLSELIEKGYRTGRPIRVELDANSSVVLKIRNGQVSAEFVSNSQAAAFAMQHELDDLRNRMAARNLPVGVLEYKYRDSQQSDRNSNRQQASDDGEQR